MSENHVLWYVLLRVVVGSLPKIQPSCTDIYVIVQRLRKNAEIMLKKILLGLLSKAHIIGKSIQISS